MISTTLAHPRGTPSAELRSDLPEADAADVKTTDDLMTALQLSRDQVPVLNMDGVCVLLGCVSARSGVTIKLSITGEQHM